MKNPTIDELFGNLNKIAQADKCSAARAHEEAYRERCLPCKFAKAGNTTYCTVHKGLKL